MSETYHHFSFKIDKGLHMHTHAPDFTTAKRRMEQMWPRSSIEFMGVDLPDVVHSMGGKILPPPRHPADDFRPVSHHVRREEMEREVNGYADAINRELANA